MIFEIGKEKSEMQKIAVIGAGTMGSGIAQVAVEAGYQVNLRDIKDEFVAKGIGTIKGFIGKKLDKGKIDKEQHDAILARLKGTTDMREALDGVELVVEAVLETIDLKKQVFKEMDQLCGKDVILSSNTSKWSITEIGSATAFPERVVGTHFFSPVPLMRLVEVVKGAETSQDTIKKAVAFCEKVGKTPIIVKDVPGFIVNRFLCLLYNEGAYQVLNNIASKEDIDKGLKLGANHPMGILELMDAVGVDVIYYALESLWEATGEERYNPCPLFKEMVDANGLGRKTGQGFYEY
jgi:3-hydroxybutyryl-CoA dehydrogenase